MIPLDYWALRLARRAAPQPLVDYLLDRGIVLKPGPDTSEPARVAVGYAERARAHALELAGRTVCVVGFGGSLGVGVHLLAAGAARVILQDPYAPVRAARNQALPADLRERYLPGGRPDPSVLEIVREPLPAYARRHPGSIDLVVSTSVLEHVRNPETLLSACARLSAPRGLNVHVIDLRDHYFRRPFEMLCYSERVWRRFLDASNHLNRLRLPAWMRLFERAFGALQVDVLERLRAELRQARARIRPEFLTGDEDVDAAAIVRVEGASPRVVP